MKKWLVILLAIGTITCLFPSCSSYSDTSEQSSIETSDPSSSISITVSTDSTTIEQSENTRGTETLITNHQCNVKIKVPDNWKDRYFYEAFKTDEIVLGYTFYNKVNYEGDHGGYLFSLCACTNEIYRYTYNTTMIGQNDHYVFYKTRVLDVEYSESDESMENDYKEMYNDIEDVIEDFIIRNDITGFNNRNSSTENSATVTINGYDIEIAYNDPLVSKDIQTKADQIAVNFLLALCNGDWDGIQSASTEDFYNNLKAYNASGSSDEENEFNTANSLIGDTCEKIYESFYLQKGTNQSVFIDMTASNYSGCCEIHLSKDSVGNYLVSGLN